MSFLVDTSVWSLALRHDRPALVPEVEALKSVLQAGETVVTTGLVLQEILQVSPAREIGRRSSNALLRLRSSCRTASITSRRRRFEIDAAGLACRSAPSMRCSRSFASATT